MKKGDIDLLDLFSGIGGFPLGLTSAGFNIKNHYFSEVDKHCIANYKHNFKNAEYVGSVQNVSGRRISPDIITFGSPCQDFSLAGKQQGLDGERSVLMLEAIKLIREFKPSVFIWENVKGVFSSNNGADFWAILTAFANIGGYRLEWQLLNTSWFLPQNRERIYLVGHLAGKSKSGIFPIEEGCEPVGFRESYQIGVVNDRGILKSVNKSTCLDANYWKGMDNHRARTMVTNLQGNDTINTIRSGGSGSLTKKHNWDVVQIKQINNKKNFGGTSTKQQDRIYDPDGIMCALGSHRLEGKVNVVVKSVSSLERKSKDQNGSRFKDENDPSFTLTGQDRHGVMINSGVKKGHEVANQGDLIDFQNPKSKTRKGRVSKNRANTLDTGCSQGILEGAQIRRLTEIECERLQGFPDDWTKHGNYDGVVKNISKSQRYKMCGNAVTTKVVQNVAEKIELI